ncbi:MAG: hypothetical protein WCF90_11265 [Methanomicrobiales archaeon]
MWLEGWTLLISNDSRYLKKNQKNAFKRKAFFNGLIIVCIARVTG